VAERSRQRIEPSPVRSVPKSALLQSRDDILAASDVV